VRPLNKYPSTLRTGPNQVHLSATRYQSLVGLAGHTFPRHRSIFPPTLPQKTTSITFLIFLGRSPLSRGPPYAPSRPSGRYVRGFRTQQVGYSLALAARLPSHHYRIDASLLLLFCCDSPHISTCPLLYLSQAKKTGASLAESARYFSSVVTLQSYWPLITIFFVAWKSPLRNS